jgi:ABC-type lipoprotein release transport system permease subunit
MARREIRRRWRGVVVLTLLVAMVGAVVLAASAGARRTSTALERFRDSSLAADIELDGQPTPAQLDQLRHVDGVAAVGQMSAAGVQIPSAPDLQSIGAAVDDQFGVVVDRDRIVAGRAPDPSIADEIAIGESLAAELHLGVGDHLDIVSFTPDQITAIDSGNRDVPRFEGPAVTLRIVGISRRPLDLGFNGAAGSLLVLTPAFEREYADRIGQFGVRVRIRVHDGADVEAVEAAARSILGDAVFAVQRFTDETGGASDATDVLTLALWLFAAVTATAGAVAIGFVLTREISLASRDQPTLRALGFTRRERVATTAPLAFVAGVGGAALAVVGAIVVSPLFPFGVARQADPDVGLHADWLVIALGTVGSLLMIMLVTLVSAWRASTLSSPSQSSAPTRARPSRVVDAVAGAGLPPTVANGVRMALESGKGRMAMPVRSAFVAAVLGVAGVTAVLVFASSLGHLVATPRLYGWTWDFKSVDVNVNTPCGTGDHGLGELPQVTSVAEVCYQVVSVDGRSVPGLAFTTSTGEAIVPEVVAGRAPRTADEVALGSTTLQKLGKKIGDSVNVRGRASDRDYEIVGRVVFPTLGQVQPLADGVAMTGAGFAPIYDPNIFFRYFVGDIAADADRDAVEQRIGSIAELTDPSGPSVPAEIDRLRQINWFPTSLAALIGALAFYAVGYALITSVRRRRRELAILKTLGFSRRQVRVAVAWQATTLATIGVIGGIPVGLLIGVQVWQRVAHSLGVESALRIPTPLLLAQIPIALVLVNLLAFFPARHAARTLPAEALRSE